MFCCLIRTHLYASEFRVEQLEERAPDLLIAIAIFIIIIIIISIIIIIIIIISIISIISIIIIIIIMFIFISSGIISIDFRGAGREGADADTALREPGAQRAG